jgi:hypothetical protein
MLKKLSSALDAHLKQLALATTTPSLNKPVGTASPQKYIDEVGHRKLGWRAWRRRLVFAASGQAKFRISSLQNVGRRGLWLYFGEGQIGDALMDLAPRSLLQAQGFSMDLLTDEPIARLFQDDPWFVTVTADVATTVQVPYDFVIVLSHKRRSLKSKSQYFRTLPWVSILEDFTGPNFDRAAYAAQRLSDLLALDLGPAEFSLHTRQKLRQPLASADFEQQTQQLGQAIALTVGGVDPLRTYKGWSALILQLMAHGQREFLLVGSANGAAEAQQLAQEFGSSALVHNHVGHCSLAQSHALLAAARVAVCTDGGLMHLAATTETPVLGLFSATIQPEWRLHPRAGVAFVCSNSADVNDVSVPELVEKTLLLCHAPTL